MMSVSKLLLVTGLFLSVAFVHTASAGKLKLAHGITKSVEGCVIDCSTGQYHRHPTDCHKFIQCAPYGPQEMPCPATTVWDQSILTCNYESAVACETGNYLTEDGNPCPDDGGEEDSGSEEDDSSSEEDSSSSEEDSSSSEEDSSEEASEENLKKTVKTGGLKSKIFTTQLGKLNLAHGTTKTVEGCVIDCSAGQYHRHPTDC